MEKKSSAHYQREYRKRLRDAGLIKKEVWVLPQHGKLLLELEKKLRTPEAQELNQGENMTKSVLWTTESLSQALQESVLTASGAVSLELIDGADPALLIRMKDYGDLPMFLTVAGEQILAESVLWPLEDVRGVEKFNDEVLRTHKLFPLSTISLDTMPDGEQYYTMFGALSATSILENVIFEIETLADNVIKATEAYGDYIGLNLQAVAE
jgi:hypothetical protein